MKSLRNAASLGLVLSLLFTSSFALAKQEPNLNVALKTSARPTEQTDENSSQSKFQQRIQEILKKDNTVLEGVEKGHLYVPKGTKIQLRLTEEVSSKRHKQGHTFILKTTDNLLINNVVVIPKDTDVHGVVLKAHGNGLFGGAGHLEIDIPSIKTINGVDVPLDGYLNGYGKSDNGTVAVVAFVSVIGGAFMRGTNIYYHQNQLLEVTVKENTDLLVTPETLEAEMNPNKPHGQNLVIKVAE